MFPSLLIGDTTYYMTGLGIFLFLVVFTRNVRLGAKKYRLTFPMFTRKLALLIIIVYLCSTYVWYLVNQRVVIPLHINQILLYLSPWGYKFYLGGILLGAWLARVYFKKNIKSPKVRLQRMFVFVKSAIIATIPLGVCLLFGDNVIGETTNSWLSVTALMRESNVATYGRVIPRGLYLSIWAGICLFAMYKRLPKNDPRKRSHLIIAISLLGLNVLLLFQIYPRLLVFRFASFTLDFKNYVLFACTLRALRQQLLLLAPTKKSHETDIYNEG